MANTYSWQIRNMKYEFGPVPPDDHTDVVVRIDWTLKATSADGDYTASVLGVSTLAIDPEAEWIPYEDITEEQAVEWVENELGPDGVAGTKSGLDGNIANQQNPTSATAGPGTFPWDEDDS